jgi:uncharacterized protein
MIYLDTSVALAHLLAEDRHPPDEIWAENLISSRLFLYEIWRRIHSLNLSASHGAAVSSIVSRIALIELAPPVLERALEPFPRRVRMLDALHLATITFLRKNAQPVLLATYDRRMLAAASALGIPLADFI